MKRRNLNLFLGSLIFFLSAIPSQAAFEDVFFDARSAAMGGAMTAIPNDQSALFYNPAALGQTRIPEIEASDLNLKNAPSGAVGQQIGDASAILPAPEGLDGAFGFAGLYDQNSSVPEANREIKMGYGSRGLFDTGNGTLDLGGSLDYLNGSVEGGSAIGRAAIDFGALYKWADRYSFGFSALNLGEPRFSAPQGLIDIAPTTLRAGFSESLSGYTVDVDAVHQNATAFIPALNYAALGMERWFPTAEHGSIAARAGLNMGNMDKSFSAGIGWRIMGAEVDYALLVPLSGATGTSEAISLSFRFGASDPQAEFERILKEEIAYRKKLSTALQSSQIHQWQLEDELKNLKQEMDALKSQLADKTLSEKEAKTKLESLEGRLQEEARQAKLLKEARARAAKMTEQDKFTKDWNAYQKLKLSGAPNALLIHDVKEILRAYKNKPVDLAPANRELLRLINEK